MYNTYTDVENLFEAFKILCLHVIFQRLICLSIDPFYSFSMLETSLSNSSEYMLLLFSESTFSKHLCLRIYVVP